MILGQSLFTERFWYFRRNRFNPDKGLDEFQKQLTAGGTEKALTWARSLKNPLGRMFTTALENTALTSEQLYGVLYGTILRERVRFEKLLGGMGTLANAATLLGLLGTVTGVIRAFGLFIGIPTLFFANYFSKKAADMASILESTSDLVVVITERVKGKGSAAA